MLRFRSRLRCGGPDVRAGGSFSPLALFAANEPGGWYDPSDLTTLYQDAAGTTPVTAVEQPVGLVLDKSKGLVLGSELVTNGTFDTNVTGWSTQANVSISWVSGELQAVSTSTGTTAVYQDITTVAGRTYKLSITVRQNTGNALLLVYNGAFATLIRDYTVTAPTTNTTTSLVFTATGTTTRIGFAPLSVATAFADNISVRELPGNHLSQSTAAARPVLSARVNLLTYSEQFDNAVWSKLQQSSTIPVVTADQAAAPNGTNTADEIAFGASGTGSQGSYLFYNTTSTTASVKSLTFYVKAKAAGDVGKVLTYYKFDGTRKDTKNVTLTANWQQVEASTGTLSSNEQIIIGNMGSGYGGVDGQAAFSCYIWGADLRPANAGVGLPAYQRVGAATSGSSTAAGNADYDTTGFPYYLRFDGVDDFLQSSTITPGSVDKAQVFAGVRKLSDAAIGILYELSSNTNANNGTFNAAPSYSGSGSATGAYWSFQSKGTLISGVVSPATFPAPQTVVHSQLADISGDLATLRVNGTQVGQSTADQGTGNFLAYPLYVCSRAGTSLFFNGQLYSLILRFSAANLDAATITATETWVNGKTRAF